MEGKKHRILLAEGDRDLAFAIERSLVALGFEVYVVFDGVQALNAFENYEFDLFVADETLSRVPTGQVIKMLKPSVGVPVILLSEKSFADESIYLDNFGYSAVLLRPFSETELRDKVNKVLDAAKTPDEDVGELLVSYEKGEIFFEGKSAFVTIREIEILNALIKNEKIEIKDFKNTIPLLNCLNKKFESIGAKYKVKNDNEKGYVLEEL